MKNAFIIIVLTLSISYAQREKTSFPDRDLISVTGEGIVTVKADNADFYIGCSYTNKDILKSKDNLNKRVNSFLTKIDSIPKAKVDYSLTELDVAEKTNSTFIVTRKIHMKIHDLSKLDYVFNQAVDAGFKILNNINWQYSKYRELEDSSLTIATQQAQHRAVTIANKFNNLSSTL